MNNYFYYKIKRLLINKIGNILNSDTSVKSIDDRKVMDIEESNCAIYQLLKSDNPCLICRYGTSEMQIINDYFDILYLKKKSFSEEKMQSLITFSGFFGDQHDFTNFAELYIEKSKIIDGVALLTRQEEFIIHKYANQAKLFTLKGLEPYYSTQRPWSYALEGKIVLVIHPFSDTIRQQYEKHEKLFADHKILPNFKLIVQKSVQTLAGEKDNRFTTWFNALEYMTQEALKVNFDIAIVGCGAYGLPLAAALKENGKKAIHMGGATQVLFGIKGNRWDNHPYISKLYNEYWTRPNLDECIKNKNSVEHGCYW